MAENPMTDAEIATDLTPEEILELFGGPAPDIIRTPDEQAELEWIMRYVEKHGHQP